MTLFTDPDYLRENQYRDDTNFRARFELHLRFSTNPVPWHRWVFDRLRVGPDAEVLEVGCGPAELWRENRERIPPGWRLTLADLSPGMLEAARGVLGDRAAYRPANVQELPFEDGSFDVVIANHMLYHVPDRPQALMEIARVLRHGGHLYVSTNGRDHLREIDALVDGSTALTLMNEDFGLETAAEQLAEVFTDVVLEEYPCDLEVTEVEPVVAFIRSMDQARTDEVRVRRLVAEEIERNGSFHVTKATGLFCCRKP